MLPRDAETFCNLCQPIHDFYEVLSGNAGDSHDWERLRALFVPHAKIIPNGVACGTAPLEAVDVGAYVDRLAGSLRQRDFFERGLIYQAEVHGNIASVISGYEARHTLTDPEPFKRGVNYIHLLCDGTRWLIAGMIWQDESPEKQIH